MARARSIAHLAHQLRQQKYDWVINLHASPSSALIAYATGARTRAIHFHGHHHRDRYSTVPIPGKGTLKPILERDMDTLRGLGLHIPAGKTPRLFLQTSETEYAKRVLQSLGLPDPGLTLSLGASRLTKTWPIERFAALALQWIQKERGGVLALTGPEEQNLEKEFLNRLDDLLVSEVPQTEFRSNIRRKVAVLHNPPLKQLAALLSLPSVWVGSDSGPKHLAVAVGTPTVTLFGPEDPFEWHPYPLDRNPYLYRPELTCRKDADPGMPPWCGLALCPVEENKCMRLIGVDSVIAECQRVARR
jgi:heptosyltransferase-2